MSTELLSSSPPEPLTLSPSEDLVDRPGAAAITRVKSSTLAYWAHVGKFRDELPYALLGKKAYYRRTDCERFVASRFKPR